MLAFICWVRFDRKFSKIMDYHVSTTRPSCYWEMHTCISQKTARVQLHAKDTESEISANTCFVFNITPQYTTKDRVDGR